MFEKQNNTLSALLVIGIVVLIVLAVTYPWYSYKVTAYLFGEDIKAATAGLEQQAARASRELQAAQQRAQREAALAAQRRRVAQVKVAGVADMPQPVVIASMVTASLNESRDTLCRQASQWLKRPLAGTTIRVQRFLGERPAQDIGRLRC